ncbi:MAG TPA: HepT-like ribonuclease domain-containing protein [Candidatus Limnocylindria bacterium]|nr:HepT-like ribonuclease domain-containing protein [Candidatus Limnocylindria bacterium]
MAGRTRWYLEQAREYATQAIDGRARLGHDWAADPVTRAGLTHLVEAVAEYLGHVPETVREAHPTVPWKEIAGMRTIAAHAYHQIDARIVEATILTDLPGLLVEIEAMLVDLEGEDR